MTSAQLGAICFIAAHPGYSQKALAAEFGQDESAITVLLRRLEAAALIVRAPHPDDGRTKTLRVADEGDRIRRKSNTWLNAFNRRLRKGFSRDEIAVVDRFWRPRSSESTMGSLGSWG